ncbi:WD40 repeat-like protein [Xylariaceae sp. FL1272]|nr:WD40 repeat-like protein [Xylariaceae sp. FL1272]
MEPFPAAEPDEGYSEHPLNSSALAQQDNLALSLRSSAEIPAWLSSQMPKLSLHEKKNLAMLILNELPTTAIADIVVNHLNPRLYINFVNHLPPEICLKVLGYLDATSLIHVALCCRGWHELAADHKLWEKLYYLEGWRAITSEIQAAEKRMNESSPPSQAHTRKLQSIDDGHVAKKRAIRSPSPQNTPRDEDDYELVEADVDASQEAPDVVMSGTSLFGGGHGVGGSGSSFQSNASVVRKMTDLVMRSPSPLPEVNCHRQSRRVKGKETAIAEIPVVISTQNDVDVGVSTLPKSTLWNYDTRNRRYKMNWKYLYSMRRRLEGNWERGRFINFQLPHPDHPEEGHRECIYSLQYNSAHLVSGSRDKTLRIWNLRTRRLARPPLTGHNGSVLCLQFDSDPDEDLIVSGSSDSDVILWKFSTGEILQRLVKAHRESVLNVKFDKRILVTCSKDKSIKIFNRRELRFGDLGYSENRAVRPVPVILRNYGYDDSPLDQLSFTPAYSQIACLEGHGAAVNAVQICDRQIVSASGDRTIKLWDWPNQIIQRVFLGHSKGIACVQYDGRRIVSGSSDNEVKVFDSETGLEVASLRAHGNLVRTVQAGFGDLPYSREEDHLKAKAVDQAYFQALNDGYLDPIQPGKRRAANAGSSRPENITAYGAKLPPGGGGGPYGRIVSGSYDQSIIIWRRDREGEWRREHTLRQEEGAAAAYRQSSRTAPSIPPRRPTPSAAEAVETTDHQNDQSMGNPPPPPPQPASAPPALQRHPPPQSNDEHHTAPSTTAQHTLQATAGYTRLIDQTVPQGPSALFAALQAYPRLIAFNSQIQLAIDREPDAIRRSQLRQIVSTALVRAQIAQRRNLAASATTTTTVAEASTPHTAQNNQQGTSTRPSQMMSLAQMLNNDAAPSQPPATPAANGGPPPVVAHGTTSPPLLPQPHAAHSNVQPGHSQTTPVVRLPPTHTPEQEQGLAQPQSQSQTQAPAGPPSHPIAMTDTSPARIFKLQFDARQIICCSQVSTIVGWDFCNGDPELEEASRFFGTIE